MRLIILNKKLHIFFAGFVFFFIFGLLLVGVLGANHIYPDDIITIFSTGYGVILLGGLLVTALGVAYSGFIGMQKGICLVKRTSWGKKHYTPKVHDHFLHTTAYKDFTVIRGAEAKKENDIKMVAGVIGAIIISTVLSIVATVFFALILRMLG